ncbi:MAG TPA: potassium-transporting ATPase subunit C [Enhygromyxa sp.]|nr:potassium-transporting ATPase subunit C [Enhygromyxa sp.]
MGKDILTSLRFVLGSLLLCSVLYPAALLLFGMAVVPARAEGSLVRDESGQIVGSRLVAQAFERPEYLWARPSAVDYNAAGAGGSNLAPSNPALTERARAQLVELAASESVPVPGELVAASGSGLDPHVTLDGARYQVERIASARGVGTSRVEDVLRRVASVGSPWSPPLVNVLEANMALDEQLGVHTQ